jgi:hypothetical protein
VRTNPWLARIAATTIAGKSWSRVRLVRHPLTESQAVGEQIRIVDLDAHAEMGRLGPDFWLFDAGESDAFAIVMRYDAAGSVLGYERTTDGGWCSEQYAAAMAGSISLAEYLVRAR